VKNLLLGSGGIRTAERLQAWKSEAADFMRDVGEVLFIPYAGAEYDSYAAKVVEIDFHPGKKMRSIHTFEDPFKAMEEAECISIGGGNTFRLLTELQRLDLLPLIREKVLSGTPYVGVSAGSNMACPTIKTTNDMPIVAPSGLEALGLVSFQINPHFFPGAIHYYDGQQLEKYGGETREDRIREFHEMNDVPVIGLYEGSILRIHGDEISLRGVGEAIMFRKNQPSVTITQGSKINL